VAREAAPTTDLVSSMSFTTEARPQIMALCSVLALKANVKLIKVEEAEEQS
jgi:hypothetical protein